MFAQVDLAFRLVKSGYYLDLLNSKKKKPFHKDVVCLFHFSVSSWKCAMHAHTHTHTHITRLDLFCLVPEIPINFTPMLREITNAQYSINSCNKNVTFGAISLLDHSFL